MPQIQRISFNGATIAFDKTNPKSIEKHAKLLIKNSFREVFPAKVIRRLENMDSRCAKGLLGQYIEECHFGRKPNCEKLPDFKRAGVELKTTPIKKLKRGEFVAKERLVLNIIDYFKMAEESFESSTFYQKNKLLLLIFYLFEDEKYFLDFVIKLAKLWHIEDEDLKIIKDDWLKIQDKIKKGKAHEISEGDTLYLGACTKGASNETKRKQPYSHKLAKQRALSLKQSFMSSLFQRLYENRKKEEDTERAIKSLKEYKGKLTFEDLIIKRFEPYVGKTTDEIHAKLNLDLNKKSKNYFAELARRIMGVKTRKIEEFEKAEVVMKTIRLKKNGVSKESMSFPAFKYTEIIKENWNESNLKEQLEKRFFFVIYQFNEDDKLTLKKVMFWTIPMHDLDTEVRKVWQKTVNLIKEGNYSTAGRNPFPKESENQVSHVRPHGRNNKDKYPTPQGGSQNKRCFWLNAKYISRQFH